MSIPASELVNVIPGVLGAGGNPLSLNAIFLTQDPSIPIGRVQGFSTLDDVQDWFGASSLEGRTAAVYFAGFIGCTALPGTLYFAQFNTAAVAGYLRGADLGSLTLTQLQLLSGTLALSIDGTPETTGAIDLSTATSFSNAASLIQTALQAQAAGTLCTYDSLRHAFLITSPTTGVNSAVTAATAGALSTGLKLTTAAGAVTSAGAIAAVPAEFMSAALELTQNWGSFMTLWEPAIDVKLQFAAWVTTTNNRYCYSVWDTAVGPTAGPDGASFGALTTNYNGVLPVWGTVDKAAFQCAWAASLDFGATNGRATLAYRGQAGLAPDVTNATVANNLALNGYNFYASYATANQQFQYMQPGQISGAWNWADTYVNQIYFNSQLQLAFMTYLAAAKSVPYNQDGFNQLRNVAQDPVNEFLNFGGMRAGIELSASQKVQINSQAGAIVAPTIQSTGWFLKIADPGAVVRANRGSPDMVIWYTDGGSIRRIELSSIAVE